MKRETWSEFVPDGENAIAYLLKMGVPVYFQVDQVRHLVYCVTSLKLPPMDEAQKKRMEEIAWVRPATPVEWDAIKMQGSGFHAGLDYLRLDSSSLEKFARSRSRKMPLFTNWGLATGRKHRVKGHGPRGRPIKQLEEVTTVLDLVRIEFEKAFVIDKHAWDQEQRNFELGAPNPLEFLANEIVHRSELFLDAIDIARLMPVAPHQVELCAYPFKHQERMPGIYWMFQAAFRLNHQKIMEAGKKGVRKWLKEPERKNVYKYRSVRTAEKFVWLEVNRGQGGDPRGELDLDKISWWDGDRTQYEFPFVSKHLSMILAVSDWWFDLTHDKLNVSSVDLAEKLMVHGFAGLEVGDLVYLISGARITDADEVLLKEWTKVRKKKWRGLRDRDAKKRTPE